MQAKWRSEWLDWQPPEDGFVGFDGPVPVESQIIEAMEGAQIDSNRGEEAQEFEQCAISLPSKPTKPPSIPRGVKLVRWNPKQPPVGISRIDVVTDVEGFITDTLVQLGKLLYCKAEQRKLRDLVDALEQCGVVVRVLGIGSAVGDRQ